MWRMPLKTMLCVGFICWFAGGAKARGSSDDSPHLKLVTADGREILTAIDLWMDRERYP